MGFPSLTCKVSVWLPGILAYVYVYVYIYMGLNDSEQGVGAGARARMAEGQGSTSFNILGSPRVGIRAGNLQETESW